MYFSQRLKEDNPEDQVKNLYVSYKNSSAVVEPSVEPSADESKGGTEPTSDSGIIALAVVASLAAAGAFIVKKSR